MLRLHLKAPFAACRTFTAGWYRPTAPFLTPSAAYGLLLNVAGIESRLYEHNPAHEGTVPASLTRTDLPSCRIAIGIPPNADPPGVQSLFQQLHNYPVGTQAGMPMEMAMGNKNNISPVRREILTSLDAIIVVQSHENGDLETRIERGLRGELNVGRYGLPFVGDNSFLLDRLDVIKPVPARWYQRMQADDAPHVNLIRLTAHIDRADMSQSRSFLYALASNASETPPDIAWTAVGPRGPD